MFCIVELCCDSSQVPVFIRGIVHILNNESRVLYEESATNCFCDFSFLHVRFRACQISGFQPHTRYTFIFASQPDFDDELRSNRLSRRYEHASRNVRPCLDYGLDCICDDTQVVNMTDTVTKHINLSGDTTKWYVHRIEFVNNSSSTMRVVGISLTNTNHFYIFQTVPSVPDTLAPGEKISVIIHFYGDSSGTVYRDTMVVTVDNALLPYYFYMSGYSFKAPAGVGSGSSTGGAELSVFPNPAKNAVQFELVGMHEVHYQVLDILGNVVAEHSGPNVWQWSGAMVSGALAMPGTYFVRAEGHDASGNGMITTRKIVMEH